MSTETVKQTTFRRLLGYIKPYRAAFALSIVGMLGYAAVDTFFFSQIETLIDDGLTDHNSKILIYGAIFVPVVFIARGIFNFIASYFLNWVGFRVVTTLRQELFDHMMRLPVSFHDQHSTGDLISKITLPNFPLSFFFNPKFLKDILHNYQI